VPRDVTQEKPLAEDSFEKARREFFGTAKTTPAPSALSADYPNPRNAPLARQGHRPSLGRGCVKSVARSSSHVVSAIGSIAAKKALPLAASRSANPAEASARVHSNHFSSQ
jgi:hypothetical protein